MNLSAHSLAGRLARLPLKLIPKSSIIPILQGPARGMKWIAGSSDNGCWIGSYEQAIQRTFQEQLKPSQTVYDIGAHAGFYTLLSSALVGPQGHVYAFEPLSDNLLYLHRHIKINNLRNITVIESAVSDTNGILRFSTSTSSTQGRLCCEGELEVNTITLDSLLNSHPPAGLIKIDIEGAELEALNGAKNMLTDHHPTIILATHSYKLQDECRSLLESLGYQVREITGPGADTGAQRDFLCVKC